ncbi:MAG: hypothetical protein HOP30_10205 [Cyclobacteriaceae bacterium]|nr:hypothetical protein [Cyclobacteriaceae bacterium]
MTFEDSFQEIRKSKDKYRISNLLGDLGKIEPDYHFLDEIMKLSNHRTSQIKWGALGLLAGFNSSGILESFFLEILNNESDDMLLTKATQGLRINGTEKSIDSLLNTFKKGRDGSVKGNIIQTLRCVYLRNHLKPDDTKKIHDFIGNEYPYFHGYWTEIKKAKTLTAEAWEDEAGFQLYKNYLNLVFRHNDEIDIHIHIEKMNSHFIRFIYVTAIYKKYTYTFSKYYTPSEFNPADQRLFDSIFDRTKTMRPDGHVDQIINLLGREMLPTLIDKIKSYESLKKIRFNDFCSNEDEIYNGLFGTSWDFVVCHKLTNSIDVFNDNSDKDKFIDLLIGKWRTLEKDEFSIINYLESQKNSR